MTANTDPIFSAIPDVAWGSADGNGGAAGPLKTQNLALDGTGTVLTVFTAGANGSFVVRLRCRAIGTNIQTVLRVFINNGSTNATIANNIFWDEVTIPATTVATNAAIPVTEIGLGFGLPAGFKINVALGTTVAAGYFISVIGGDY